MEKDNKCKVLAPIVSGSSYIAVSIDFIIIMSCHLEKITDNFAVGT